MTATIDDWLGEFLRIMRFAAGNPENTVQVVIALLLAFAAVYLVLQKLSQMLAFTLTGSFRAMIFLVTTLILMLIGAAAANLFVLPSVENTILSRMLFIAVPAMLVLVVSVPAGCFLFRSGYGKTVGALLLSLSAGAVTILLVLAVISAITAGTRDMNKTRKRKEGIEQIM